MTVMLMSYVLRDYKFHLKKHNVIFAEFLIGFLMTLDVILYSYINKFKFNYVLFFEYLAIVCFFGCFIYISLVGINDIDEDIELILMTFRIILQFIRLGLAIVRYKQNSDRRQNFAEDLDLELTVHST